jgi:hypothetical protein
MVRGDVNGWTTAHELIRDLVVSAMTRDFGASAFVNRVGDAVREIIYHPGMITVTYDPASGELFYQVDGQRRHASEVLHVRGPFDKSPLTLAVKAISVANARP